MIAHLFASLQLVALIRSETSAERCKSHSAHVSYTRSSNIRFVVISDVFNMEVSPCGDLPGADIVLCMSGVR